MIEHLTRWISLASETHKTIKLQRHPVRNCRTTDKSTMPVVSHRLRRLPCRLVICALEEISSWGGGTFTTSDQPCVPQEKSHAASRRHLIRQMEALTSKSRNNSNIHHRCSTGTLPVQITTDYVIFNALAGLMDRVLGPPITWTMKRKGLTFRPPTYDMCPSMLLTYSEGASYVRITVAATPKAGSWCRRRARSFGEAFPTFLPACF